MLNGIENPETWVALASLTAMEILALSFLLLIGVMLVADGMGQKIPKGYIHFAMAFSLAVQLLNMRFRTKKLTALPQTTNPKETTT